MKKKADFTHSFVPTRHLLFRISALTFNAHRIHIDPAYARDVEGFPDQVCHGALAVIVLLEIVRLRLRGLVGGCQNNWHQNRDKNQGQDVDSNKNRTRNGRRIKRFDYRCLAPMFVDQPYTISGRVRENRDRGRDGDDDSGDNSVVEVWALTPEGGYSVRGTVILE